jgi:hypothetical protein
MKLTRDFSNDRSEPIVAGRPVWIALIITSGTCLSPFFACITPFAALATLAALKLNWRDAIVVVALVWLANQAIGYGFLGYPWTWDSVAWGAAIGVSSGLAILAARGLSSRNSVSLAVSLPFVAAFAAFELGLYLSGLLLPGSEGAFSASVIGHVFLVNAIGFCALIVVHHLVMMSGLAAQNDKPALLTVGDASWP